MENVKVGLMGVGLNTYWNQFDGLLARLNNYQKQIKDRMEMSASTLTLRDVLHTTQ